MLLERSVEDKASWLQFLLPPGASQLFDVATPGMGWEIRCGGAGVASYSTLSYPRPFQA